MRHLSRLIAFAAMSVAGIAANASAAPITLSAPESIVLNFDFPGTETYAFLTVEFGIDELTTVYDVETDSGQIELFTDLDATESVLVSTGWEDFTTPISVGPSDYPPLADGIFSLRVIVTSGSLRIDPRAFAERTDGTLTEFVFPLSTAVPEPTTVTLLGVGLAAIGARRWRRRRITSSTNPS